MSKKLTDNAIKDLADRWCVEEAAVRAVIDVESSTLGGFMPDGEQPVILYEAHVFARNSGHKYNDSHPELSSRRWDRSLYCRGGWPRRGYCEHERLQRAVELNREAALKACSWGLFQVLGENWNIVGYESLQSFINAMYRHEDDHLRAFAGFCEHHDLIQPLQEKDWATFARIYNGPSWQTNDYDAKMERAYQRFS